MSNKNKKSPVSDLTERYDELVSLDELKFDDDNIKLYGSDDNEYIHGLGESIDEYGLMEPVIVYDDNTVKSGHTRIKVSRDRGYTHIPVVRSTVKKPNSSFRNMMALMMGNQGRPSDIKRQFNQIVTAENTYELETSQKCSVDMLKNHICPATQMSHNMYKQLRDLQINRKDLFDRVVDSNGSALSPGKAYDLMLADRKSKVLIPMSKILETMVKSDDIIYATSVVSNAMNQLGEITVLDRNGEETEAFEKIQQNTIGGLVHESFTNAIAHSVNFREGSVDYSIAFAPKNQRIEDITFPLHNAGIEVKTCVIKDGNKVRFVSGRPKTGYHLFAAFTPDYDYAYVAYGYLKEEVWKKAGRAAANIDLKKLQAANLTEFIGTLKVDKLSGNIHCIPAPMNVNKVGFTF
tara:strand:- start:168 stop:1385 length:1218 start_codon:yes stop_codon:yes gene_type:complete